MTVPEDRRKDELVEYESRPTEGVRIVGAYEAGELLRRQEEGETQQSLFAEEQLLSAPETGIVSEVAPPSSVDMPHWSEPATGEVPTALARDDDVGDRIAGPAWSDERTGWHDDDFDHSVLADAAYDDPAGYEAAPMETFAQDAHEDPAEAAEDWGRAADEGGTFERQAGDEGEEALEPGPDTGLPGVGSIVSGRRTVRIGSAGHSGPASPPPPLTGPRRRPGGSSGRGDRNVGVAVGVGLLIGVAIVVLFLFGPASALFVVTVVLTMALAEYYAVMRKAGYKPASLLGLVGTICMLVAGYERGEPGVVVVLGMMVVFTLLWYLWGVGGDRPGSGVAVTLLGFLWVSFLGGFSALLLDPSIHPLRHGVALLFGAIVATVSYDVAAYAVGSRFGSHLLVPKISPNKTWEGLVAGMAASVFVSAVAVSHLHPYDLKRSLALGLVVAVAAPLGDLCQSMIKRDAGVKDMSSALPGHGGVLDRIDAMLFVMPAVYFLARVLNIS
jgi:phosphatidate cytidylyltransferase